MVAAVGPAAAAPAMPPAPVGTFEMNQNRSGMDYRNFDLAVADPRQCQQACQAEGRCQAWTYVNPGVQRPAAHCWLKGGVPPAHASPCCVSGTKLLAALHADKAIAPPAAGGDAGAAPAGGGSPDAGVFVLLGHWATREIALDHFNSTRKRFPELLGGRDTSILEENEDGRTLYRNRVGPFPDARQAREFCGRLMIAGGFCLVPSGQAAAAAAPPERPAAPAILSRGKIEVPQSAMVALAGGGLVRTGGDLSFEAATASQLLLVPQNGAALAPGNRTRRDFGGCAAATYSPSPVSVFDLPLGSYVCVKTRDGRIGEIKVDGLTPAAPHTLALNYVVWQ
jgi:hypothetical protein